MAKQLTVVDGADKGRYFPLVDHGIMSIGNRRRNTDICLHDLICSRVHCELEIDEGRVLVKDFEDSTGTYINGQKIRQQELQNGEVLRVGNSHLRLEDAAEATTAEEEAGDAVGLEGEGDAIPEGVDVDALDVADEVVDDAAGEEAVEEAVEAVEEAEEEPVEVLEVAEPPPVLTADHLEELTGHTLAHYQLGPVLGKGHTGVTFQARDLKAKEDVALKVLCPDFPKNEAERTRFVQVLKATLPLRHENIVALLGAGRTSPYSWVAMEYVEGESLADVIERLKTKAKIDWRRAYRVAVHMARALEFVHERNLVHRNVTPQNILWQTSDKTVKLSDLFLAKSLHGSLVKQMTLKDRLMAELVCQAPEQTMSPARVDHLSDIYSLGVVLYALLTGRWPCEGETPAETVRLIRGTVPVKPSKHQPGIPAHMEKTVMRMLAKLPEERHQSATELLEELVELGEEEDVTA